MTTKYIRRTVATLAYLLLILSLSAQGLRIGQPMPDITFTRLINTEQKELSLSSLKGKNVILYNYPIYCAPCIRDIPIFNTIRDGHREDLEIILLSDGKYYDQLVKIFENLREIGRNITLIQAAPTEEDYKLLELAKEYIGFSGGYTWIDKEGNYQGAAEINKENVAHFIKYGTLKENMKIKLKYAPVVKDFEDVDNTIRQENFKALKEYDPKKPLLFAQEGKNIRSGSIFTGYNPNYPDNPPITLVMKDDKPIGIRIVNTYNSWLYDFANIRKYEIDPLSSTIKNIEIRKIKKSISNPNKKNAMEKATMFNGDSLLVSDGVCYELILPNNEPKDIPTLLAYMRKDLDKHFGLNSRIEMRKCLALVEIEKGKMDLKSRYKNSSTVRDNFSVSIRNGKVDYLISAISYYYLLAGKGDNHYAYVLNHTGIDYNIDIELVADMEDLTSVKNALNKVGLDLIETEAIGEVCVISDH